jgi:hypothetical protein
VLAVGLCADFSPVFPIQKIFSFLSLFPAVYCHQPRFYHQHYHALPAVDPVRFCRHGGLYRCHQTFSPVTQSRRFAACAALFLLLLAVGICWNLAGEGASCDEMILSLPE